MAGSEGVDPPPALAVISAWSRLSGSVTESESATPNPIAINPTAAIRTSVICRVRFILCTAIPRWLSACRPRLPPQSVERLDDRRRLSSQHSIGDIDAVCLADRNARLEAQLQVR